MKPFSTHTFQAIFGSIVLFVLVNDFAHGLTAKNVIDSPMITEKIGTNRTIKVDLEGDGDFKSVQEAIDAVPEGNSEWVIIHLRKGVFREKVHIPKNKPYIFLRGNGKGRTHIVWDHSTDDNIESATLRVEASHFIAFGVSFKNEANIGLPSSLQTQTQSVAAVVEGDKVAFYHCGFYSAHNTLFDRKGRHYYLNCYIQGNVDFIFGRGQSIFQSCEIFVLADSRLEISGSITAHRKEKAEEATGFVFLKGKVYGIGSVYLGRAKGAFSRVIFAKTYLSRTIAPEGWTNWSHKGSTEGHPARECQLYSSLHEFGKNGDKSRVDTHVLHFSQAIISDFSPSYIESNILHGEYECHGPGSESSKRAPWAKQLTDQDVASFMNIDFIDGKEWLPIYTEIKL